MSTNPNLIIYVIYFAVIVWTLINYAMCIRNKTIDLLIISGILIFLFPASPIIIPLGVMGNFLVSITGGMLIKARD